MYCTVPGMCASGNSHMYVFLNASLWLAAKQWLDQESVKPACSRARDAMRCDASVRVGFGRWLPLAGSVGGGGCLVRWCDSTAAVR